MRYAVLIAPRLKKQISALKDAYIARYKEEAGTL